MELFHASHQWATRPADQRFNDLQEIYDVTRAYYHTAREKEVDWSDLRVEATGDDLHLIGRAGIPAQVTHYAFGQLSARAGAPAEYLRDLPPTLAAQNLNFGLARRGDSKHRANLLFHSNGTLLLRAATTEVYERLWNWEVAERLLDASNRYGMVPARQTFNWGGGELAPESERPAALYASDHDLWCFVMSRDRVITDPTGNALLRGVIVSNSEVGDKSLGFMSFYFRDLCCNHIIWGASEVLQVRYVHKGNIRGNFAEANLQIRKYLDSSTAGEEAKLSKAFNLRIAASREEVLDKLFGIRAVGLPRKVLAAGYDACDIDRDGDPRTVWGMTQGLTRYSQTIPYADEKQQIDRAAGKLLAMEF